MYSVKRVQGNECDNGLSSKNPVIMLLFVYIIRDITMIAMNVYCTTETEHNCTHRLGTVGIVISERSLKN